MANYKLTTATPTQASTSFLAFAAGATNTVVSSVVASDAANGTTLEVLVKKNAGSVIELSTKTTGSTNDTLELLTAPVALEALDELYVRTSRQGANFVISYVEETTTPNDTALGGLVDVSTSGATDGQALAYNLSLQQWEPQTITGGTGGATDLDGLSDVLLTSVGTGDMLRYNGVAWVNLTPTTDHITEGANLYYTDAKVDTRIGLADFGDLADVDMVTTAPSTGDGIEWDGTNWVPTTSAGGNHAFHQIAVLGESVVEADSANDVLELAEGTGIAITTDATNDKITFTVDATADEIDDSATTNKFVTAGDITKLGHISVTQAVDLDTMESTIASNTGLALAAATAANTASNDLSTHTNSIENHADVTFSFTALNRPNEAFIVWNDVSQRWEDQTISIDKCNDVDTSTAAPSVGDILEWDGSNWVPTAPSTGGGNNVHDTDTSLTVSGQYDAGAEVMDFTTIKTGITMLEGRVYSIGANGWDEASRANATSLGLLAVCGNNTTTGSDMVIRGLVVSRDSLTTGTRGQNVYLHTSGKWSLTAPTSGAAVVILGKLIDPANNVVFFDPDKTVLQLQ